MSSVVAGSSETSTGPRLLIRGLDSLYVSFWLDVATGALDFDDLAFQKEKLRQSRSRDFTEISLSTETFALKPFGRHPYPFQLSNDAFEIRLTGYGLGQW